MTTPSTSASSATLYTPTETAPLLSSASKLPHEIERIHDEEGDTAREVEVYEPGRSGFAETLLNVLGDIIGTGLLACPIAIAHAGWVFGPLLLVAVGLLTLWTLKILIRIIEKDRVMRSFTDVVAYGLGAKVAGWVTVIFLIEITTWLVTLVVLFSDSINAVWPIYSSDQWKLIGLVVIIPTAYLPLHIISYSSAIGVASTWGLIGILLFSGIVTPTTPGSIRDPAPTDLWPAHGAVKFLTCFGLFLSGFGGHAMIPTLIRDMKKPKQADRIVEIAYGIAMTVYLVIAICGYIMYGTNVSDEISKDLARTPGVTPLMNKLAVWTVAINPLTKIALAIKPLSDIIYSYFNLHPTMLVPLEPAEPSVEQLMALETVHLQKERSKRVVRNIVKLAIAVLAVAGALIIRSFESMMGVMGSGFGGLLCIVIPVWAGCSVFGWTWWRKAIILLGAVFAAIGVVASAWPETRVEPY